MRPKNKEPLIKSRSAAKFNNTGTSLMFYSNDAPSAETTINYDNQMCLAGETYVFKERE